MFRVLSVCFTGSMKKVIWPREAQAFRGKEQPVERTEKAASSRFFDSSAVRCDVVTHRGIEPRSTPSESATLSVELMGHIEYLYAGARKGTGIILKFIFLLRCR